MSLIRVRRNRKKAWIDVKRGPALSKLALLLALVAGIVWYLGRF